MDSKKLKTEALQKIEQKLTPTVILQLRLTSLPLLDLEKYLYEVAEENPYLKVEYQRRPFFKKLEQEYQDSVVNSVDYPSLLEDLKEEVLFLGFSPQKKWIADIILTSILPNGMLSVSLESIAKYAEVLPHLVQDVFEELKRIAPIREFSENPILSIFQDLFKEREDLEIAQTYWSEIEHTIKKNGNISQKDRETLQQKTFHQYGNPRIFPILLKVDEALEELLLIQNFFDASEQNQAVILKPDCQITMDEEKGLLDLIIGNDLTLSIKSYEQVNANNKELFRQAQNTLHAYQKRERLFYSFVELIVSVQKSFFVNSQQPLNPLSQKDLANTLNVQPSTISRLIHQKYFWYKDKIYPFSVLITKNIKQKNGRYLSQERVKKEIQDILKVTRGHKITDQKLQEFLQNRGIYIARRTVNKYRRQL